MRKRTFCVFGLMGKIRLFSSLCGWGSEIAGGSEQPEGPNFF